MDSPFPMMQQWFATNKNGEDRMASAVIARRPLGWMMATVWAVAVPFAGSVSALALLAQPSVAQTGTLQTEMSGYSRAVAEAATADPALASFYASRHYAPIWTSGADAARREAFFTALAGAGAHGLPVGRYDAEGLKAGFRALQSERQRGQLEVAMSVAFLSYARDIQSGVLTPSKIDPQIVREIARPDPLLQITAFAAASPAAYLRSLPPSAPQYAQLMKAKSDLEALSLSGGWGAKVPGGKLSPGDQGKGVIALRDRLQAMGYLGRSAAASFDTDLQKAVQAFQADNGLTADGVAGEATLAEINRDPQERLKSVIVAMERLRWMHGVELGSRHIWVNLPDFTAKVMDDGKLTFETVAVVGMNQSDRRTPEFSDVMEYMVVNPTWNVPRSITVKEYLPMMQANPNAAGHLTIVDGQGRAVPRSAINFAQYTAKTFPFGMKQPPSDGNALGLVKFMFPNKWNIYLHDTPSKSLFSREVRAFSHGCIRLQQPFDFAYTLLSKQTADPEGLFKQHLRSKSESTISLAEPVPVHLVYFTAWPTARGGMEYRRDIYGRDGKLFDALAKAGVALSAVQG
jgi:L,D-transpeptidase YcbB